MRAGASGPARGQRSCAGSILHRVRGAAKLIVGLTVIPCVLAAVLIWIANDDAALASNVEGWAQLVPFALVPIVVGAGLLSVAFAQAKERRRRRR